jgi:hypothetical protein
MQYGNKLKIFNFQMDISGKIRDILSETNGAPVPKKLILHSEKSIDRISNTKVRISNKFLVKSSNLK